MRTDDCPYYHITCELHRQLLVNMSTSSSDRYRECLFLRGIWLGEYAGGQGKNALKECFNENLQTYQVSLTWFVVLVSNIKKCYITFVFILNLRTKICSESDRKFCESKVLTENMTLILCFIFHKIEIWLNKRWHWCSVLCEYILIQDFSFPGHVFLCKW